MRTRPVRADELDLFVEAGGNPGYREDVRKDLMSMFAAGSMRPEWCFVVEEENRYLGRAAVWTLPGMDEPFALVLIDVPWEDDHLTVGKRLLEDMLANASALGAKEIEHVLDAPPMQPQFQDHPERRAELLGAAGFAFRRETDCFEWQGGRPHDRGGDLRGAPGSWNTPARRGARGGRTW